MITTSSTTELALLFMTDFSPNDRSVWWDNAKAAKAVKDYKLLFAASSTYEAYLFAFLCKSDGFTGLIGSATTVQEATDLIEESGTEKLICLLSDTIASDSGAGIAEVVKGANVQSHCILIVNDPEKCYSMTRTQGLFSALCSSGNVGRGGLYRCLESILVEEKSFVDPVLKQAFVAIKDQGVSTLSARENEILSFIAQGLTNKEIGSQVFLAEKTVRDYVSSILNKLGVANRASAAAWALRHGLV